MTAPAPLGRIRLWKAPARHRGRPKPRHVTDGTTGSDSCAWPTDSLTAMTPVDITLVVLVVREEMALANPDRGLDAGLLVLMSLATGPKHGYAIIKDVEAFADSRMGPGTLYAAIERLEKGDLIAPVVSRDRRKPYRLTPSGLEALRAQADALKRLASVATRRLATR